jgi:hypothetical protein
MGLNTAHGGLRRSNSTRDSRVAPPAVARLPPARSRQGGQESERRMMGSNGISTVWYEQLIKELESQVDALKAEIAAQYGPGTQDEIKHLSEQIEELHMKMDCGHLQANLIGDDWGHFRCTVCAQIKAERAAALQEAIALPPSAYSICYEPGQVSEEGVKKSDILALIDFVSQSALDRVVAQAVLASTETILAMWNTQGYGQGHGFSLWLKQLLDYNRAAGMRISLDRNYE